MFTEQRLVHRALVILLLICSGGLLGFADLQQDNSPEQILLEELIDDFGLPALNQPALASTQEVSVGTNMLLVISSSKFTEGNAQDGGAALRYHQYGKQEGQEPGYVTHLAECEAHVSLDLINLAQVPAEQQETANLIQQFATDGLTQEQLEQLTQEMPAATVSQQPFYDTTIQIISGKASEAKREPGYTVDTNFTSEVDYYIWMRGDWAFQLRRNLETKERSEYTCNEDFFEEVPEAMEWAEEINAIGEELNLFSIHPPASPYDLSIRKMMVFQAVAGGDLLVAGRPTVVAIYLHWPDANSQVPVTVKLLLENEVIQSKTVTVKHSYNAADNYALRDVVYFVIPGSSLPEGTYIATVEARLGPLPEEQKDIVDPNPDNNIDVEAMSFLSTQHISMMFTCWKTLAEDECSRFFADSSTFFTDVFPTSGSIYQRNYLALSQPISWILPGDLRSLTAAKFVANGLEKQRQIWNTNNPNNHMNHFVGVMPRGHFDGYVSGTTYGLTFPDTPGAVMVTVDSPTSLAHEVAHTLGFQDEYGDEPGHWLPSGTLIYKVMEQELERTRSEANKNSPEYINFMGNASIAATWVDADTWRRLFGALRRTQETGSSMGQMRLVFQQTNEPVSGFLISGYIDVDGAVQVLSSLWLNGLELLPLTNPTSGYRVMAIDSSDNILAQAEISVPTLDAKLAPFIVVLPAPADSASLVFAQGEDTVLSLTRSASAPQVNLAIPEGNILSENVEIQWQANDLDGDSLTYALLYSPDNGETWLPLATDLLEPHFTLPLGSLPGGEECRLRVIASDGWNTSIVTSEKTFAVQNKPPSVVIGSPSDGDTVYNPVVLFATANDPEDGLLAGEHITWLSDQDGNLGQGEMLEVTNLSTGQHTITAVANDLTGTQAQASITVSTESNPNILDRDTTSVTPLVSRTALFVIVGGLCLCGLGGILVFGILFFFRRTGRRSASSKPHYPAKTSHPGQSHHIQQSIRPPTHPPPYVQPPFRATPGHISSFRLVIIQGPQLGQAFALTGEAVRIGRDASNDIVIEHSKISRRHALLVKEGPGYVLQDLNSSNGVFVNGQQVINKRNLILGDRIALGSEVILIYDQNSPPKK